MSSSPEKEEEAPAGEGERGSGGTKRFTTHYWVTVPANASAGDCVKLALNDCPEAELAVVIPAGLVPGNRFVLIRDKEEAEKAEAARKDKEEQAEAARKEQEEKEQTVSETQETGSK
eukprot:703065-Rhodomonas_salina.1